MSHEIEFAEATVPQVCPHCGEEIERIEYSRQELSFGFMSGFSWVILLSCLRCRRVLGTQTWD